MTDHAAHKRLLAELLHALAASDPPDAVLDRFCHADCRWEVFHPFNTLPGNAEAARGFWAKLRHAFPDHEQRIAFALAGEYEGRDLVSSWGLLIGTFDRPWLGIPPTHGMASLRFGVNAWVRNGRIAKAYVLLDIPDLMLQAGVYPFRRMPGGPQQWPFPPCDAGATASAVNPERGARTLQVILEMQRGLPKPDAKATPASFTAQHSHHWHEQMNWYGPAGIGSTRGLRGFRNFHGALWLQAFPDRGGFPRVDGGPEDAPGHYIRLGDGNFAMTSGWPSVQGSHFGPEWLGLPPTGRKIRMRVADWYRIDADEKIADNWVMIDVPHMVRQMGLDIFHDLAFAAAPDTDRWPEPPLEAIG